MQHILIRLISIVTFILLSVASVYASAYQLTTVGSLNTTGAVISHLWYTNGNLTFTGVAPAGEVVTATIDGASASVTADSSGNWNHPVSLAAGDHSVAFAAAGTSFISFTLTIGEAPEGIGELKVSDTPTAGNITPTLAILSSGLILSASGFLLRSRRNLT